MALDEGLRLRDRRRRLHGRRGLKYYDSMKDAEKDGSPPSRAAWIEIFGVYVLYYLRVRRRLHGRRGLKSLCSRGNPLPSKSPPSRAAWIEIELVAEGKIAIASPPSRAAWIEIVRVVCGHIVSVVAAFTGGVD